MRSPSPARYVLGIDFGTLSGRALLVDARSGREVATAVHEYAHGVLEKTLPGSRTWLEPKTALQDPADYLEVLRITIPQVLRTAKVSPEQVVGIGTDFTSCTMLPTRADGTPLCFDPRWRRNPHAWVKLWKHHAAQPEADRINAVGRKRRESFIGACGGRYSSEWFFAKLLETVRKAPAVYAAADRFIEAGDWIVWQLCGEEKRCASAAGFKAMWGGPMRNDQPQRKPDPKMRGLPNQVGGYPSREFFRALHPKMADVVWQKLGTDLQPLGARAGGLTRAMARLTGLREGTPVVTGNIDAHAAVPACGVTTPGQLVMILGTSTCHLLVDEARHEVEGMCGVVRDGVIEGWWGYEAGQAGVGDMFAWFMDQGVPGYVQVEAARSGRSVYHLLEQRAAALRPGESGLLALDWWNGCRSVLMDSDLTGLLVGASLRTRPHEIYRALIEATAFGTRKIIDAFTQTGVAIDELHACGGLAQKSPLLLQIYADVTGRPIRLAASEQTSALGAALYAAVAAGLYTDIHEAARRLVPPSRQTFRPVRKHQAIYDRLYGEYSRLHDLFGRGIQGTMKLLRNESKPLRRTFARGQNPRT